MSRNISITSYSRQTLLGHHGRLSQHTAQISADAGHLGTHPPSLSRQVVAKVIGPKVAENLSEKLRSQQQTRLDIYKQRHQIARKRKTRGQRTP